MVLTAAVFFLAVTPVAQARTDTALLSMYNQNRTAINRSIYVIHKIYKSLIVESSGSRWVLHKSPIPQIQSRLMNAKDNLKRMAKINRMLHQTLVPHFKSWLCIHHYEGSWTDPNAPYYGGLQMDMGFQIHYGYQFVQKMGTADHWPPLIQMFVTERAFKNCGFYPWPNTARYCGLI